MSTLIKNNVVSRSGDTMTGNLIFSDAQKIIGGTSTTADLSLQTTSGVGATGADMHFLVGNNGATEAMTILNSGNVGIGTTGPSSKLQVMGVITTDNTNYSVPNNAGTTDATGDKLVLWEAASSYRSTLGMSADGMYIQNTGGGVATSGIRFYTGASTASEIMRIQRDGSVAIGSSYVGTAGPSNGIIIQGNVGIGTTGPTAYLHLKAGTATASTAPIKLTSGTVNTTPEAGTIEYDGTDFFLTVA